ncbi:hypothetical protein F5148DRAFT_1285467 [Russula earlei]|uniref:Uncharacterized protein n=1 Tax=Russula earlei TaxID=71964 RepID=A0ACC0U6F4_9AGAM|nr:hypothetical protein F5148DRAFT_1285467 [Russula earlei]
MTQNLAQSNQNPYQYLDRLYLTVLSSAFPPSSLTDTLAHMQRVLGCIVVLCDPLSAISISAFVSAPMPASPTAVPSLSTTMPSVVAPAPSVSAITPKLMPMNLRLSPMPLLPNHAAILYLPTAILLPCLVKDVNEEQIEKECTDNWKTKSTPPPQKHMPQHHPTE